MLSQQLRGTCAAAALRAHHSLPMTSKVLEPRDPDTGSPDPADLSLSSYGYDLPEASIAQRPMEPRHEARMLAVAPFAAATQESAGPRHLTIWDLQHELRPGDLLEGDTREGKEGG